MKSGGFIEQFGKTEGPGPRTMHKKHPFVGQDIPTFGANRTMNNRSRHRPLLESTNFNLMGIRQQLAIGGIIGGGK